MTRTLRFPWYLCVPLLLPLAFPIRGAVTDLRAWQLSRQAETRQNLALFDEALALRRQAVLARPGDARAQLALAERARGLWYFRDTETLRREADVAFGRATELSPHWPVPHYEHARMYAFKAQHARALSLLAPALDLDPNNAGYWLERARLLGALGRATEARAAYGRCLGLKWSRECERGAR
ncbi:hypothetical protein DAETH_41100 (plasmid) [Deinococcus aetherius]|uniref:Tetratricopeptide repeat protein n=1 Tax=Deinococcus aetherius TaxID=200252 RepID=A0ABM8AJZ5_9DEIO|nr:tetratricopeptide repeat protein [Deinococcus aetherius]BDP44141.1 hypothetical protein DAETH_41100 [Deinococcus aetherius]